MEPALGHAPTVSWIFHEKFIRKSSILSVLTAKDTQNARAHAEVKCEQKSKGQTRLETGKHSRFCESIPTENGKENTSFNSDR